MNIKILKIIRDEGLLFKQCRLGIAKMDDQYFEDVFSGATCKVETFGFSEKADLRAENVRLVSDQDIREWHIM